MIDKRRRMLTAVEWLMCLHDEEMMIVDQEMMMIVDLSNKMNIDQVVQFFLTKMNEHPWP
jgi:hypothetical protein